MIVELWKKANVRGCPVLFKLDEPPQFINEDGNLEPISNHPPVKSINFYETGALGGKPYRGRCYVIQFQGSEAEAMRRIIPAKELSEILWLNPEKTTKLPELEG